jgi:signal peptidase I
VHVWDENPLDLWTTPRSELISTITLHSTNGYFGDGRISTNANLSSPSGLALDALGSLYFCRHLQQPRSKGRHQKIISTVTGSGNCGNSGDLGGSHNASVRDPNKQLGKEVALRVPSAMRRIDKLGQNIWQKDPLRWLLVIIFAAIVGVVTGHAVIASISGSVSVVDGTSMAPSFLPGSRVYTAPISTPLERGDVVLIDDGKKGYALKRIVAMPGESVQMWRGHVFINKKMLREPYLAKHTYTFPDTLMEISSFKLVQEQYFVMGDNRDYSEDSRRYGPIERAQIRSRVPSFGESMHSSFGAYTLPSEGKRNIKAL